MMDLMKSRKYQLWHRLDVATQIGFGWSIYVPPAPANSANQTSQTSPR